MFQGCMSAVAQDYRCEPSSGSLSVVADALFNGTDSNGYAAAATSPGLPELVVVPSTTTALVAGGSAIQYGRFDFSSSHFATLNTAGMTIFTMNTRTTPDTMDGWGSSPVGGAYVNITAPSGTYVIQIGIVDNAGNKSALSTTTWTPSLNTRYDCELSLSWAGSSTVLTAVFRVNGTTQITHTYTAVNTGTITIGFVGSGVGAGSFGKGESTTMHYGVVIASNGATGTDANVTTWPLDVGGHGGLKVYPTLMLPSTSPANLSSAIDGSTACQDWVDQTGAAANVARWDEAVGTWTNSDTTYNHPTNAAGVKREASGGWNQPTIATNDTLAGITHAGQSNNGTSSMTGFRSILDDGTTAVANDVSSGVSGINIHEYSTDAAPSTGAWTSTKLSNLVAGFRSPGGTDWAVYTQYVLCCYYPGAAVARRRAHVM